MREGKIMHKPKPSTPRPNKPPPSIKPLEVLDKPSHSFCKGCTNIDTRVLKDTINILYIAMTQITDYLGFDGKVDTRCKKVTEWVRKQQKLEENLRRKNDTRRRKETTVRGDN